MIIKEITYIPYLLKFKIQFHNSFQKIKYRDVLIISITDEFGNIGYGECSPLPGFSFEGIDEVKDQIYKLSQIFAGLNVDDSIEKFEKLITKRMIFPSVRFGLEQSFLNLISIRHNKILKKYFGVSKNEIPVNAVFGFDDRLNIITGIEKKITDGYKTIKLKIGHDSFDEDLKLVESVRKFFGDKITIRLDVNGKWIEKEAWSHLSELSKFDIEYIEEPCIGIDSLITLSKKSPIPIAVDESLRTLSQAHELIKSSKIKYYVIKPTIFGGLLPVPNLIYEAEKKKKIIIISSSFESCVGLGALAFLASLTKHNFAHGLDTIDFFEKNAALNNNVFKNGKLLLEPEPFPQKIDLLPR